MWVQTRLTSSNSITITVIEMGKACYSNFSCQYGPSFICWMRLSHMAPQYPSHCHYFNDSLADKFTTFSGHCCWMKIWSRLFFISQCGLAKIIVTESLSTSLMATCIAYHYQSSSCLPWIGLWDMLCFSALH